MKRWIAGTSLVAALLIAAVAMRPTWVAPDSTQVQTWLHDAADRRDAKAEASLGRWSGRGNAEARHAYSALLAHRHDAASRARLEQVLDDSATAGDAADATQLAELIGDRSGEDRRVSRLLAQGRAAHVAAASRLSALRALDAARGTPDRVGAARLMARASAEGDVQAMFLYANMLRAGQGVTRDDAGALTLYQRAADADYAPAIQALTIAWRYGELGLQADASQSRLMDHEAAEALAHSMN